MDPTGYNWKVVSPATKEIYFQEFKKLYTWPADQETVIKKYWTKIAQRCYSDMISTVVKKCIGLEVDGLDSGYSKHSCGSRGAVSHLMDMTKKNGGVEPPLYELQKKIHMSKKTKDWVDPKAKRVYEMVTSQLETMKEQLANSQGESDGSSCTVTKEIADDLYVKVVGGVQKRCLYVIGGVGTSLVTENQNAANIVSSSSSIEQIVSQTMQTMEAEMV